MSQEQPGPLLRLARRWWPAGNPLARTTDWAQTALLVTVVLLGLVLVPVALVLGSEAYAEQSSTAEAQARTTQPATAILTANAPPASLGSRGTVVAGMSPVPARWQLPDGSPRVGQIQVMDGSLAGARVSIWIDRAGNPVNRPVTSADAVAAGVTLASVTLIGGLSLLAGMFVAVRLVLDRCRYAAWQREWTHVEPAWRHRPV